MQHPILLFFFSGFLGSITGAAALFLFCLYFFPTLIAILRGRHNTGAIFLLNFFLGWTFVGWIISLVWAVSSNPPPQQIIIHNNEPEKRTMTSPTINPTPRPGQGQDKISQLRQLKQLLDDGTLTLEEFNQQKARILAM